MKYLLLSDIHGNSVALEAIFNAVDKKAYDKILVMGDNIGDGPAPDVVLDMLLKRDAIMIAGNREVLAKDHYNGFAETQTALQWQFMRLSLDLLSKQQQEYIFNLPKTLTIKSQGLNIRMVHGSPYAVRELLYYYDTKRLDEVLDNIDEDILLCGHNHFQFAYPRGNKLVLNPGSVGLSQKSEKFRADYAILTVTNGQYSFELNHVYYDGEKIKQLYIDRNLWDINIWGQVAYREMSEGKKYIIGFARHVFNIAKNKNASTAPIDDQTWCEAVASWNWTPAK